MSQQARLPRRFGARLDPQERNRHVRILAIGWPILLVAALTLPRMAQKARVAGVVITIAAVRVGRAARSEVKLRLRRWRSRARRRNHR